ncbi:MAG: laminin B domain-containing protein [Gammaproteobacteria bacterium]
MTDLHPRRAICAAATALLALAFTTLTTAATVTSTFETDAEGWLVAGDAVSGIPTWVASDGNPGGHIQANDSVAGGVWYFDAPAKFLGAQSGAYGGTLSFDLRQTGSGSQFDAADVILNGGGLELRIDAGSNPLPVGTWVSYSLTLVETAGWTKGGAAANQSDLLTVLGALDRLRIRGEFISGSDTGRLDNVVLNAVPVPAAAWLLGPVVGGLILRGATRRRRVQA